MTSERWQQIRNSPGSGVGAAASLVLVLPLLRAAARRDTWVADGPGIPAVHTHSGLFLSYGLLSLTPALIAAVAGLKLRRLNVTVVIVIAFLAAVCELFVSADRGFTF